MYVAYDQVRFEGNRLEDARGSHFFIPWRRIEDGPRGYYDWSLIDDALARLAPGKKAILRLVLRCADTPVADGWRDACAPNWVLAYDPIFVRNPSCEAPTKRLNYLNPVVQQGLVNLIHAMGARYREDPRIAAMEIGFGYGGETAPWPYTHTVCDRDQQKRAYRSRPEYAEPGKAWAEYEKRIIQAYVDAFQGQKALTALINGAYAERYRGDVVRFAVAHGVGFALSSLRSEFNANRGSANNQCYWGLITEPGFENDSQTASAAYLTEWAPLVVNQGRVPIGFEFNNRYDNTGRIPPQGEAFTRWSALNALDKGADYILAFNDGDGFPGNIRYPEVWRFFNRYAGRDAATTPDVWIAFRSPWKEGAWCPDIYDYSWHLISELETLPYVSAVQQRKVNRIDAATGVFDIGPASDWRSYNARTTADAWPAFNLDIDDAFVAHNPGEVEVEITYFDHDQGGQWALYYDSDDGEKLAGVVTLTGGNVWKTSTFRLKDAHFANGLPPLSAASRARGFDLRLDRMDAIDDIFSMVRVIPAPAAPPPSPTFAPPTPTLHPPTPTFAPPTATPTPTPMREQTLLLQQGRDGFQGFVDTYLSKWQPKKTFAKKTVLALRINHVMTSLLQVDLSTIPPGSEILQATLHLIRVDPRDATVSVHAYPLLRDWDASATYNRASKKHKWQKPGALGKLDASVSPVNPTPAIVPKGGVAVFDLTDLVQKWVDDPAQNHGLIFRGQSRANRQYSFGSSNARKLELRPYLEVRFIPGDLPSAPTPTSAPTATPTATPTSTPTAAPTATFTPTPTTAPTTTPTPTPTATPTTTPTPTPTAAPTATFTPTPTATPTPSPQCMLISQRRVPVGPAPKGVAAWPDGFLVGLFDDASLVIADDSISKVATSGWGINAVVYQHDRAYLVHRNSANVSVVSLAQRQVIAAIPVGAMPWGAAANEARLFVANFADSTATIIDLATNQPLATTPIHSMPALAVAGSHAGYITHLNGYVSVLGNEGALQETFGPLPGGEAFGVALDETGRRLFVSNRRTQQVMALDSHSGEVLQQMNLAPHTPYALAYSPRTRLLFALDAAANQLLAIQPETGEIVAQTPVSAQNVRHGGQFLAVSEDGAFLYVPAFDAGVVDVVKAEGCR